MGAQDLENQARIYVPPSSTTSICSASKSLWNQCGGSHACSYTAGLPWSRHILWCQTMKVVPLLSWLAIPPLPQLMWIASPDHARPGKLPTLCQLASPGEKSPWGTRLGELHPPLLQMACPRLGMPWGARPGKLHPIFPQLVSQGPAMPWGARPGKLWFLCTGYSPQGQHCIREPIWERFVPPFHG